MVYVLTYRWGVCVHRVCICLFNGCLKHYTVQICGVHRSVSEFIQYLQLSYLSLFPSVCLVSEFTLAY